MSARNRRGHTALGAARTAAQAGNPGGVQRDRFFTVEPEAAGSPADGSPPGRIACVFDSWLGDDLIRAYPAVLVTTPVKRALLGLLEPSGFEITRAGARASRFFRTHNPGKRLPTFWAIQIRSNPGRDDMGLTEAGILVVSRRVLDVLLDFRIGRAVLTQYAPGRPASRVAGRDPKRVA